MKMNEMRKDNMQRGNTIYNGINIFVILITVLLFASIYVADHTWTDGFTMSGFIVLLLTVILVHLLKAFRLFLALYGSGINVKAFLKTYCKVTPVSVILPFKAGDIFRMYCYGNLIGNVIKGFIVILYDRFMDTAALVTIILIMRPIVGSEMMDYLVYFFVMFLAFVFAMYIVYPGIKNIWTKFLIKSLATERKMWALETINRIDDIYREIKNVSEGRGVILYFLSLAAWGVEIGSLYVLGLIYSKSRISNDIFRYLRSALSADKSVELKRFIVLTIVLLLGLYVVLKLADIIEKRNKE